MSYVYVFLTIFLTVLGQVVIKWQVLRAGTFPADPHGKLLFLAKLLINPWIMLALAAALVAAVAWMAAMTRLELSHAYPFMSLAFILVLVFSALLFNEPVTAQKIVGLVLISVGIIVGSQG
jgi:multidrug transporter EmrE-like cation transporter